MEQARSPARNGLSARLPVLCALALPVCAGLAYMAGFGAPLSFLVRNAAALVAGVAWLCVGQLPRTVAMRRVLAVVLIMLLALPLLAGPYIGNVARWIPLGPALLHSGMFTLPSLLVLAARDARNAPLLLLAALFLTLLQPDGGSAFAITFACVGLYRAGQDWQIGIVSGVAFLTAIAAALRGELPAAPFVERVLVDAAFALPIVAVGMFAALLASFFLILFAVPLPRATRFALAGSLFGFTVSAIISNYPSPLIGFGAAPILGYALALSDRPLAQPPEPAP